MIFALKFIGYRIFQYIMKVSLLVLPFPVPKIIRGNGAINDIANLIKTKNVKNPLIVTDKGIDEAGLLNKLTEPLKTANINYTVFDGVLPNPTIDNIEEGLKVYQQNQCDGIITIGGGSPMDCAKIIAARAVNPRRSVRKMQGLFKVWHRIPPLIAIPTTAGTGSETTVAAVVSDPSKKEKFAIVDIKIVPHIAILDPSLTVGLPPHLTASTGLDALTHAVESYIGLHCTKFTNQNAERATKIIFKELESVFNDGTNLEKREQMLLASFYAGSAFTRASVGYVHAIAHNLGGLYHVPHGLANAIVLPYVLEFSKDEAKNKLAKLATYCGIGENNDSADVLTKKFIDKIIDMNKNLGIPDKVKEIQENDIPLITKRVLKEANPLYPVPKIFNERDCEKVLRDLI